MTRKVFGIGLNKTGTTTPGASLERLGDDHVSCRADLPAGRAGGRARSLFGAG